MAVNARGRYMRVRGFYVLLMKSCANWGECEFELIQYVLLSSFRITQDKNPFILSNVWGWNGLHTGNHKVWGKLMVGDVFHAVCIILPHDVFLWSWDMTFMSSIGWCLHANTRGFFAGLWEFVFFTAHSPLRLFKAMRYSKIINSNKLWR